MKKYMLFLFSVWVFCQSQAQVIEQKTSIFSSGFAESSGGNISQFGVLGIPISGKVSGGDITMEIGFIIPNEDPIASLDNELLSKKIVLYPNPVVEDKLQIGGFPSEKVKTIIYNAQGKVVMPLFKLPQENTIEVSHLESGLYFLYLYDGKYKAIKKFQKR